MGVLASARTKVVTLTDLDGEKHSVTLQKFSQAGREEYRESLGACDGLGDYERALYVQVRLGVCRWDFTDESGSPLPIDDATLRKLDPEVLTDLVNEVRAYNPAVFGFDERPTTRADADSPADETTSTS